MVTLEQVKLLEGKITRAIEVLGRMSEENARLKRRNEELEEQAGKLREEKTKVEAGIASALDRLNQFEDAIERTLTPGRPASQQAAFQPAAPSQTADAQQAAEEAALLAKLEAEEALAREKAAREAAAASQPAAPYGGAPMPAAYTEDEAREPEEDPDAEGENGGSELHLF